MENLALFFLLSQCAIGFFLLWRLNKGLYLQDIRLIFLLFYTLYSIFWPLINFVFDIVPNDSSYTKTIFTYGLALLPFNFLLLIKRTKWKNNIVFKSIKFSLRRLLILATGLVAFAMFYMVAAGIPIFQFGNEMMDRYDYFSAVTQVWVVLNLFIATVFSLIFFGLDKMSRKQKLLFLCVTCVYVVFQISMGNRREFASFLMFVIGALLIRRKARMNIKIICLLSILFIGSFVVSMKRNASTRIMEGEDAVQMALQSNEFIYPMQTTYYTIKDDWDYRFGTTYFLLPIQVLIPRSIYPSKPTTLGTEFVNKTFGPGYMAFAYTPVTEAYLNGGYLGVLFVFLILSLLMDEMVRKANRLITFSYLMAFSLVLDWSRSEFSSIFYTICMIVICLMICKKFAGYKKKCVIKPSVN